MLLNNVNIADVFGKPVLKGTSAGDPVQSLRDQQDDKNKHTDAAAKDFEALFISQMVENMFGDSVGSEAFGSEESDEVYKGLMVQEYGKMIVNAGGIGIADYVKRELLKQQEVER